MEVRIPFLRSWRIQRQAAEWNLELLSGTTPERRAEFEAWLAADPEHAREYRIFDSYSKLSPELASPERQSRGKPVFRPAYAFALACLVVIAAALLITSRGTGAAYAAVTNHGRAIRLVRLADGSKIALDTNTSLSVTFTPELREVELHAGRARFGVAPDPDRPFVVRASHGRITANDGGFDVDLGESADLVIARRGRVSVTTQDDKTSEGQHLSSGETVRVGDAKITQATIGREERLWAMGRLWFEQTPLADIVAVANRVGGPPIHVADPEIGAMKVTAVLDLRDTLALAQKLAAALNLDVQERPHGLVLTR